jgi:3-oxoadipate enol-lactonase
MTDNIDVNGTTLAYRFDGPEGAPVVMLSNSLMSNHTMWDPQIDALSAEYRVLRYDTRGHGASAAPVGPYSMAMLGEDAVALMDGLGLDKVHFCGLSMGGMIGQYLGANHGERLKSLTLCDTACVLPPASLWDERIDQARAGGTGAAVDATLERWFTAPYRESGNPEVEKIGVMIRGTDVEGFAGCAAAIRDMDQTDLLASIDTDTLVVVGEHDPGTPVSAAKVLHENIPGSELVVIDASAHLCNIEQPAAFNQALLGFLKNR